MQRILRALGVTALVSLAVPAVADAADKTDLGKENVTAAMFILIAALVIILALAVAWEQRGGGRGH